MSKPICAIAVGFLFIAQATAQTPSQAWNEVKALTVGTSVRVSVGSGVINGKLKAATDDSLALVSKKREQMFTRREVTRVWARKSSHRGRNTLIGLGAGAAIGAVIGAATYEKCNSLCIFGPSSAGAQAGLGAFLFGIVGSGAGAMIPTGGWREVYRN